MKPLAILIGFQYHDLNGTLMDLQHAYRWCQSFKCEIRIITDINHKKLVDPEMTTFYDMIIKYIVGSGRIIDNAKDFLNALDMVLKMEYHKLIIYYTGHARKQGIEMPDRSIIMFEQFRDRILDQVPIEVEIFWILDCCNPDGLSLPYELRDNQFIFKTESRNSIYYGVHRILLITSSNPNEKSVATRTGSLFTQYLFQLLSKMKLTHFDINKPIPLIHNRNLQRLIGNLSSAIRTVHSGYAQTVSIYTSYIHDPILWMWIGSNPSYDIITDMTSIIIHRNI